MKLWQKVALVLIGLTIQVGILAGVASWFSSTMITTAVVQTVRNPETGFVAQLCSIDAGATTRATYYVTLAKEPTTDMDAAIYKTTGVDETAQNRIFWDGRTLRIEFPEEYGHQTTASMANLDGQRVPIVIRQ